MKEFVVQQDFQLSVKEWFELFLSNDSFKSLFHTTRGDSDIRATDWTPVPGSTGKYERVFKFQSPTSNNSMIKRLVGATVAVTDTEVYFFKNDELYCDGTTAVSGSMSASFFTGTKWKVIPTGTSTCNCSITVITEYKGSWLKGTVEQIISDTSVDAFKTYMVLATEKANAYNKEKERTLAEAQAKVVAEAQAQLQAQVPPGDGARESSDEEEVSSSHSSPVASIANLPTPSRVPIRELNYGSDDDDEFVDADTEFGETTTATSGPITNFLRDINTQLDGLRNLVDLTQRRIVSLETLFSQSQVRNASATSSGASSQLSSMTETFQSYISRLEKLIKDRQEEQQSTADRDDLLLKKIDALNKKINRMSQTSSPNTMWFKGFAFGLLLVVWPFVANATWKWATYFYVKKILKQ